MKISFDLDDTLIPAGQLDFPTEPRSIFQKILGVEKIRSGTRALLQFLKHRGHQIGIYTTSYRPKLRLRFHLLTYGIAPDFIVTEKENRLVLANLQIHCSKYPPAFNIDLHIDDSAGVEREGQLYGYQTIIIKKNDLDWLERIKNKC